MIEIFLSWHAHLNFRFRLDDQREVLRLSHFLVERLHHEVPGFGEAEILDLEHCLWPFVDDGRDFVILVHEGINLPAKRIKPEPG